MASPLLSDPPGSGKKINNEYISRRKFLKISTITAGAFTILPISVATGYGKKSAAPKKVVVIGAGLAGLSAALRLQEAGHQVIILEAQNRPGGRVLTLRDPFADNLYAEMGAARIPASHDWTHRYIKKFDLKLSPFWPDPLREIHLLGNNRLVRQPGIAPDLSAYGFTKKKLILVWIT